MYDSFKLTGKSFYCIFENILWVREYLAYSLTYFGILFCKFCEKKILIYFNFKIIVININITVPKKICYQPFFYKYNLKLILMEKKNHAVIVLLRCCSVMY